MFVFDPKKWKKVTIGLVAVIASGSLGLQIDWAQKHIIPHLAKHPHLASLGPGIIMILTVLHNPRAQKLIKQVLADEETVDSSGNTIQTTKTEQVLVTPAPESEAK